MNKLILPVLLSVLTSLSFMSSVEATEGDSDSFIIYNPDDGTVIVSQEGDEAESGDVVIRDNGGAEPKTEPRDNPADDGGCIRIPLLGCLYL